MANGTVYDTYYDKAFPDLDGYEPVIDTFECAWCGEEKVIDYDCIGETAYMRVPGIDGCYCPKCFPKFITSDEFIKTCRVTTDDIYRRRR